MNKSLKDIFRGESCFSIFLISIVLTGIGYGVYKGMLDNYLDFIKEASVYYLATFSSFTDAPRVVKL